MKKKTKKIEPIVQSGTPSFLVFFIILIVVYGFLFITMTAGAQRLEVPQPELTSQEVYHKAAPSIVLVRAMGLEVVTGFSSEEKQDPFLKKFLTKKDGSEIIDLARGFRQKGGLGTGIIISDDGLIVTNAHVVDTSGCFVSRIMVIAVNSKGEKMGYPVKVLGVDHTTDLAVLKIMQTVGPKDEKSTFIPAVLGDSSKVTIGQTVYAFGHPFAIENSFSHGVVSGLHRQISVFADFFLQDFIQTDAAINPGNSGGALLSNTAEVIGINSCILTTSGGSNGMGFAIPSNLVKDVVANLVKNGYLKPAKLDIEADDLSLELIFTLNLPMLPPDSGVVVTASNPEQGVQERDLLINFNGNAVKNKHDLRMMLVSKSAGDAVTLTVLREGQEINLTVVLK